MPGETVERPHSRLILLSIATFCFAMVAMGLTFVLLILGISPIWSWLAFAVLVGHFLTSVFLSVRSQREHGEGKGWREWLVFSVPPLVALRVVAIAGSGPGVDFQAHGILVGSMFAILDVGTIGMVVVLLGVWHAGGFVASNVEALHPQRSEIPPAVNSPEYYAWMTSGSRWIDRGAVVSNLTAAGVVGGVLLTGLTALVAGSPFGQATESKAAASAALVVVVLYFVGLLVLNSYATLVRQTSTWTLQLAQQARGITENWMRSSFLLLGMALLIAMFLPSLRLPEPGGFLTALFQLGFILWQLVMLPLIGIMLLLSMLFAWLGFGGAVRDRPAPPREEPALGGSGDQLLEILQAVALWAVLAFTAYLVYRRVTSARPQWKAGPVLVKILITLRKVLKTILESLAALFRLSAEAALTAAMEVAQRALGIAGRQAPVRREGESLRRTRSNREQIWRIYVELLADAKRAGKARQPCQTPIEYEQLLAVDVQAVGGRLRSLTDTFVLARYAPVEIDDGRVTIARRDRELLSAALKAGK